MKTIVAFVAFLALAAAATTPLEAIPIIRQDADVSFDGTFQHSLESGNGIKVQEQGVVKNAGVKVAEASEVTGSFEYVDNEGTKYTVHYIANKNGFQPQGYDFPVVPTPLPVPAAIQRALDWIAAHPESEHVQKKY